MQELIVDFEKASFTLNKLKFRNFDFFGTMRGFHIRGFYKFQTKVGTFFTALYLLFIVSAIAYYVKKFEKTETPRVQYNHYNSAIYSDFNPIKEKIHFYFIPTNPKTGENIPWNTFYEQYTMYSAYIHVNNTGIANSQNYTLEHVEVIPCSSSGWVKELEENVWKHEI